ncbi:hypothetical protein EG329_008647 [Mollisiaceae sp. DMI_Dod_QoI]|nr:hypothetical protein EG329_008647 [Helotiales sp. DMI_Dod_QoI]
MEMPESPPPPPNSTPSASANSYWNFAANGLPVSYQIAIIIDAFVLVVTIVSLCLLGWYMRRQYRRRRLLQLIHEREREDANLDLDLELKGRDMEAGKMGGVLGKLGAGKGKKEKKERKKKGHVRWGSNVQGGSVDLDSLKISPESQASTPTSSASTSPSTSPTTSTPNPESKPWDDTTTPNPSPSFSKAPKLEALRKFDLDFNLEGESASSTHPKVMSYRVNPLGKAKSSPITEGFKGDPLGVGKTRGVQVRLEEEMESERYRRVGQRVVAGYDGFRGN